MQESRDAAAQLGQVGGRGACSGPGLVTTESLCYWIKWPHAPDSSLLTVSRLTLPRAITRNRKSHVCGSHKAMCVAGAQRGFVPSFCLLFSGPLTSEACPARRRVFLGGRVSQMPSRFVVIERGQLLALALREPLRGRMGCGWLPSHSEQTVGCCA